jgi:hypothetical protein
MTGRQLLQIVQIDPEISISSSRGRHAGNHYRNDYRIADWRKEMLKLFS